MIDAKELRIGNKLLWGVNVVTIQGIHTQSVQRAPNRNVHFYVSGAGYIENYKCLYPEDLAPIPLTPKVMERCYGDVLPDIVDSFGIGGGEEQIGVYINDLFFTVKYLHQLQTFTTH